MNEQKNYLITESRFFFF